MVAARGGTSFKRASVAVSDKDDGRRPASDAELRIQQAAVLWAQAREATSSETRAEFERLALLYERLAVRAARREPRSLTLGELLYADSTQHCVTERDWVALLRGVAQRDHRALQTLYLSAHRLVFTLIMHTTNDRIAAEDLTVEVFHDIWQHADGYDPASGTVIGCIMSEARSRALSRLRFDERGYGLRAETRADGVPALESTVDQPSDVALSSASLWQRLAERLSTEGDLISLPAAAAVDAEAHWEQPISGLSCKLLATDTERSRVCALLRLAPGAEYPPHTHAEVEELHLLQGELWIDDRKLHPGDYRRAERGTADKRVWSETGCICVLITSSRDIIRRLP
jgi:DNA-directed RNA polymerase specialized sigma24 family protein